MFLFHFTSWLKQRLQEERQQADSLEDFAQTFILEPIYTPSGLVDAGEDDAIAISDFPDGDEMDFPGLDESETDSSMVDNNSDESTGESEDNSGEDTSNSDDLGDPVDIDNEEIPEEDIGEEIPFPEEDGEDSVENGDEEPSSQVEKSEDEGDENIADELEDSDDNNSDGETSNESDDLDQEDSEDEEITDELDESEQDDNEPDEETANELEESNQNNSEDEETANELDELDNSDDEETANELEESNQDNSDDEETANELDNSDDELDEDESEDDEIPLAFELPSFNSGVFTVGESGQVGVDFLFDGGGYQGEVAFFSLAGLEEMEFESVEDFIAEAVNRAASNSEQGHIVISDPDEAARFTGSLMGEKDYNSGVYQGVKSVNMTAGDKFGVMLIPKGRVSDVVDNPSIGGAQRPLFSLSTANPDDEFHLGQIADLTGDGNTFVFEDQRFEISDYDYNDVIFQIRGAVGDAAYVGDVVDPNLDWRGDDMGQALLAYSDPYFTPTEQQDLAELAGLDGDEGNVGGDVSDDGGDSEADVDPDEAEVSDEADEVSEDEEAVTDESDESNESDVAQANQSDNSTTDSNTSDSSSTSSPETSSNESDSSLDDSTELTTDPSPESSVPVTDEAQDSEGTDPEATDEVEVNQEDLSGSDEDIEETSEEFSSSSPAAEPKPLETPTRFEFAKEDQPLVGVIDTGFAENNPDLDYDNISLGKDLVDGDDNPLLAEGEGNEHGTHILGIIAAEQDNGEGIDGINPDAPIWVGRAIGSGKWAESLVEFVDHAQVSGQPNAVVNLSMDLTQIDAEGNVTTRYEFTPLEMAALEYARQHNVLVTVAAGNESSVMSALGQASEQFDNIITVGAAERINGDASNWQGFDRADYSNYGEGLDIVADGGTLEAPIISTSGDSLGGMNGTSVATAQVTGAASQVWAANSDLSYRQVIEIIKSTATDLKDANPDLETGAGLINITAAIHLAKATKPEDYDPDLQTVPTTWSGEGVVTPMERAVRYSYALKEGETLWSLAQRELGSGGRWPEITKDTEGKISFTQQEYENFSVGQIVYIPGNDPNPPTVTPQPTPPPASAPAPQPTIPTPQPTPSQAKQDALNQFLQIFGQSQSPSWLNFLKKMFEKIYNQVDTPLRTKAPQQGTGTTSPTTPTPVPTKTTQTLSGKKILLDPGHGINSNGFDPGATGYGTTEAKENLHQAQLIAQHLRQLGADVKVLDEPLSLAQIGQRAAGNDLFISLHQNAFNKNAQGHEVFSHPNAPAKDAELARAINSELDAIFPDHIIPDRGTKTADFSVLRNAPTNIPAVLVESLFIDAPGMSRVNIEKAATAVARGIEKFFTGNATGSVPQPSPKPPAPSTSQTGTVNANVGSIPLNFRKDAYVGATVLGSLTKGTQFKVLKAVTGGSYSTAAGTRNDWYQVEFDNQVGYVAGYYVDVTTTASPSQPSGFHAEDFPGWVGPSIGVALRNSPKHSDKSGLAEPYKKTLHFDGWMYGESVNDIWTGKSDALWYRYWKDGKAYWVPSAYIYGYPQSRPPIQPDGTSSPSTGKPGYVNSSVGLNFRTGASVGASKISTLANGTKLTILESVSGGAYYPGNRTDWYKVRVGDKIGYVAAYYVKEGSNNNGGGSEPPVPDNGSWQNPLAGSWYAIYSLNEFGTPRKISGTHKGIDLSTGNNTPPIKAAKGGKVLMARYGWNDGYGNYVKIDHGNGLETRYAHLSSINVQPGQNVSAGTHIGNVGTTGNSTGNHLHFEIRVNGVPKNPRNYIKF